MPINGLKTNTSTLTLGATQGSVLGHLLFLIYINDMYNYIKFCQVHPISDDTNLFNVKGAETT